MSHDSAFVFSGIGLFVEREINRLLGREPIMGGQSAEYFTGAMTELFFGRPARIELGHGALPNDSAEVIDLCAKLFKHGCDKHFIFGISERPVCLNHHVNMSPR